MNWAVRRASMMAPVGCPCASSSQWRAGYAYGELRIGRSKKRLSVVRMSALTKRVSRAVRWASVSMRYGPGSLDGPLRPATLPNVHALRVSRPASLAVPLPYRNSACAIHRDLRHRCAVRITGRRMSDGRTRDLARGSSRPRQPLPRWRGAKRPRHRTGLTAARPPAARAMVLTEGHAVSFKSYLGGVNK